MVSESVKEADGLAVSAGVMVSECVPSEAVVDGVGVTVLVKVSVLECVVAVNLSTMLAVLGMNHRTWWQGRWSWRRRV